MIDDEREVKFPDLLGFDHVVGFLEEVGTAVNGANGFIPVTFQELESWSRMVGIELSSWTSTTIIKMSRQYCLQSSISDDPMSPAPYQAEVTADEMVLIRERIQRKIKVSFRNKNG